MGIQLVCKFTMGDNITNGETFYTVQYASKGNYKMAGVDVWLPIALVDRLWTIADDEPIIEE